MPISFSMKLFDTWLEKNRHRFLYPPVMIRRRKVSREFRFNGIHPSISGWVDTSGQMVIGVTYQGKVWDFIADLDMSPERIGKDQYICTLCDHDKRMGHQDTVKIYPTRASIWVEHSFEPLLAWSNKVFCTGLQVVLFASSGCTWCKLKPISEVLEQVADVEIVADYPLHKGTSYAYVD